MRKFAFVVLSAAVSLVSAGAFADTAADAARCQSLRNQYDRYAFAGKTEGNNTGKLEREIGVDLCNRGRHAEGIKELEKAIHLLGYTPY